MTKPARVYLICGPLCGGKTTYAEALYDPPSDSACDRIVTAQ